MLKELFEKARSLLNRGKKAGTATDAVVQGNLDDLVYEQLLQDAPALGQLVDVLGTRYAAPDELVRDVWANFYQHSPIVRERTEMDPTRLHNWAVAKAITEAPETAETREYTRHDKYGAVMATIGVTSKIQEILETNEELAEKTEDDAAAQEKLEQALEALQSAAAAAAAAEGTEDEAAVGTQLSVAISAAEHAQEMADLTAEALQQAAEGAKKELQAAVQAGVQEAGEDLAEEQEIFQAWGVSDGEVKHWSFAERQAMLALFKASEVTKHVKLMGRFKFQERSTRAKRVDQGRDEMYAITRGNTFEDIAVSEMAMLANPHTRRELLSRFAEGQLLVRSYRGLEQTGKGAIICCVDTSDSMNWPHNGYKPAAWSKAFALALLERAKADGRDFVGIIFSSRRQVQAFRFPAGKGTVEEVVAFVTRAFNGGTNFEAPLDAAIDILAAQYNADGRRKGDIVFITDDACRVDADWLAAYKATKLELGFRTWGIACGKAVPGATLSDLSDNVRAISEFLDPTPVADLMRAI